MNLRFIARALCVPSVLLLAGCASAKATSIGPSGWRIECDDKMSACASRADSLCGDRGYTVVGGGTQSALYGGQTGYQTKSRNSELLIHCGETAAPAEKPLELPPRSDESVDPALGSALAPSPTSAAPSPSPAPAATACIPGSTQKCIGPGACQGGQACVSDGSGFGPCDCGAAAAAGAPAGY